MDVYYFIFIYMQLHLPLFVKFYRELFMEQTLQIYQFFIKKRYWHNYTQYKIK